jgi:DNA (cytosine-5)-methyltransferase 1
MPKKTRKINDVVNITSDDQGLRELALFAGAGGGILGGKLLGWKTVCAVEKDPHAAACLAARQDDGILHPFPIWSDICTFDGRPWQGHIDVISGGFPCQDVSIIGTTRAGLDGKKSGLWREMARVIGEVQPQWAIVENSPALVYRGLDRVLCDLAKMGYDAVWGCISAEDAIFLAGDPIEYHARDRIWILAKKANATRGRTQHAKQQEGEKKAVGKVPGYWERWPMEPRIPRVANGVALGMDRNRCIGNGQVPAVVALAWHVLGRIVDGVT